jgi:hypothetical protein
LLKAAGKNETEEYRFRIIDDDAIRVYRLSYGNSSNNINTSTRTNLNPYPDHDTDFAANQHDFSKTINNSLTHP